MSLEYSDNDLTVLEKKAGQRAARTLRRNLKAIIASATIEQSGTMLKLASSGIKMKYDALEAIVIKASPATFIQHYGFEGVKKNGVAMHLKPKNIFNTLLESSKALEKLADELGKIKSDAITTKIKF